MKIALVHDLGIDNPTFCIDADLRCDYLSYKDNSDYIGYWCTIFGCGFIGKEHLGIRRLKKCRDAEVKE